MKCTRHLCHVALSTLVIAAFSPSWASDTVLSALAPASMLVGYSIVSPVRPLPRWPALKWSCGAGVIGGDRRERAGCDGTGGGGSYAARRDLGRTEPRISGT